MKQEHKNWLLNHVEGKQFTQSINKGKHGSRRYNYFNVHRNDVPFDDEFNNTLVELLGDSNFDYTLYHIHKWHEGCFFSTHTDERENRRFAFMSELQESTCKTKLLVENKPVVEGIFLSNVRHEVPVIKQGTRLSLTVFGKFKVIKTII